MNNMLNMANIKDKLFKRVGNVVWDMQSGSIGIKKDDNHIMTLKQTENGMELTENPLDISLAIPAFAIRTKIEDIKPGDLLVSDDFYAFALSQTSAVEDVANATIRLMKLDGVISTQAVPSNTILGMDSVMVVKNIFSNFGGGSGMNGMLPMLLLMKDGNVDMKSLLLMSMLSGDGGMNLGDSNSLLPLLLLSGKGNTNDLLPLMLMQQGGGMDMQSNPLLMLALLGEGNLDLGSIGEIKEDMPRMGRNMRDVPGGMGRNRSDIWTI